MDRIRDNLIKRCLDLIGNDYPTSFNYHKGKDDHELRILRNPWHVSALDAPRAQALLTALINRKRSTKRSIQAPTNRQKYKAIEGKPDRKSIGSGHLQPYNYTNKTALAEQFVKNCSSLTLRNKGVNVDELFLRRFHTPQDPIPKQVEKIYQNPTFLLRIGQTTYTNKKSAMVQLCDQMNQLLRLKRIKGYYYHTLSGIVSKTISRERSRRTSGLNIRDLKGPLVLLTCGCPFGSFGTGDWSAVKDRLTVYTHYSVGKDCGCVPLDYFQDHGFNIIHECV